MKIPPHSGIVCGNYGHSPGSGLVCAGVWHAACYKQYRLDKFPVLKASDLDDDMVDPEDFEEEEDQLRFTEARDGDHLIVPFQCDPCHFFNMRKCYPIPTPQDNMFLLCICQALLDSLWSRERSTISKNLTEFRLFSTILESLGETNPFPPRGPFPPADLDGMEVACNKHAGEVTTAGS